MVIGAFPLAKLGALLIRQVSKPIANVIVAKAKIHPVFRRYVCMPPAHFYNWCEIKLKLWVLNLGRPVNIPVLSQDMAIELGANLLGEFIIFTVGATVLTLEYNRQANKEAAKEEKLRQEREHLNNSLIELYMSSQRHETEIRELQNTIKSLEASLKPKSPTEGPQHPGSPGTPHLPGTVKHLSSTFEKNTNPWYTHLPYPDTGLIYSSLNYIQLGVFSKPPFSWVQTETKQRQDESRPKPLNDRQSAVLTDALHFIENNYRSLF